MKENCVLMIGGPEVMLFTREAIAQGFRYIRVVIYAGLLQTQWGRQEVTRPLNRQLSYTALTWLPWWRWELSRHLYRTILSARLMWTQWQNSSWSRAKLHVLIFPSPYPLPSGIRTYTLSMSCTEPRVQSTSFLPSFSITLWNAQYALISWT